MRGNEVGGYYYFLKDKFVYWKDTQAVYHSKWKKAILKVNEYEISGISDKENYKIF